MLDSEFNTYVIVQKVIHTVSDFIKEKTSKLSRFSVNYLNNLDITSSFDQEELIDHPSFHTV